MLARTSLISNFMRINPIEKCEHIHIWNAIISLSRVMNSKKNWNHGGKYLVSMVFTSMLLLAFGIFTYDAFAENAQTNTNNNAKNVKSPSHIPPSMIEQYIKSKICKSECIHIHLS